MVNGVNLLEVRQKEIAVRVKSLSMGKIKVSGRHLPCNRDRINPPRGGSLSKSEVP